MEQAVMGEGGGEGESKQSARSGLGIVGLLTRDKSCTDPKHS